MRHTPFLKGLAILLIIVGAAGSWAAEHRIEGKITDGQTGKPLVGANIFLQGTSLGATSDASGRYEITGVPAGDFVLTVSYLGYRLEKRKIRVSGPVLHADFALTPIVLPGQEVIVTATRAKYRETPVPFTNISRGELQQRYWAQDIPMLLATAPSVYAYSDAGNGIGYSYLKIRGFDQRRVNVMLNGIPLNDPEDHNVYWVDMPDFAASVQDIQIQRGAGTSIYGSSSFGGSVNIITSELTSERGLKLTSGGGSYGTRKFTAQFNSGLVNNTYALSARFSRVLSDGYRERSNVDLWSYFISAARYTASTTTQINLYGGQEITHAAWDGSPQDVLKVNHRDNPITYPNTIDHFQQPHYELIHDWNLGKNLDLNNTFFYIRGIGYYEGFKRHKDLVDFGFHHFNLNGQRIKKTDLVRQKWVKKNQAGWIPRLTYRHPNGTLTLGGEFYTYWSLHWGKVIWAKLLPPDAEPDHKYYQYHGKRFSGTVYVHELWKPAPKLNVMADLNLQFKNYRFKHDRVANFVGENRHAFNVNWRFFNPRLGLNYNLSPALNVYGSFAVSNLEPSDDDLYDTWQGPDDLGVKPLFRKSRPVYRNGQVDYIEWSDPLTKPERLYDFEFGFGWNRTPLRLKANAYFMNFTNEIVPYGQIGEDGVPIKGNAESTVHRGLELEAAATHDLGAGVRLRLDANLTLSQNYFRKFIQYEAVYDENWNIIGTKPISFDGNTIAGFPGNMGVVRLTLQAGPALAYLQARYVGKQYLDNSENESRTIRPFTVVSLHASYELPPVLGLQGLKLSLWVNNLFDRLYETAGYYDPWSDTNYLYPAAERNYFLSLTASL